MTIICPDVNCHSNDVTLITELTKAETGWDLHIKLVPLWQCNKCKKRLCNKCGQFIQVNFDSSIKSYVMTYCNKCNIKYNIHDSVKSYVVNYK